MRDALQGRFCGANVYCKAAIVERAAREAHIGCRALILSRLTPVARSALHVCSKLARVCCMYAQSSHVYGTAAILKPHSSLDSNVTLDAVKLVMTTHASQVFLRS